MDDSELRANLEQYHNESFGWALSCCAHNRAEAESVLQLVYLKVLEGKARFEGKATFRTWLFAVIRRTAADERRRQWLRGFGLLKYVERAGRAAGTTSPDDTVFRSEMQTLCRRALAELPKRQREDLQLVFYHELSLAEAAEVLGISLGSVRTHYERGKKQLRQWLEKEKVNDESARRADQRVVSTTEAGR
jgi:RNA polymerase sigma-70 factor (ECF subfamily)